MSPLQRYNGASWDRIDGNDAVTLQRLQVLENSYGGIGTLLWNGSFESWKSGFVEPQGFSGQWSIGSATQTMLRDTGFVLNGTYSWGLIFSASAAVNDYRYFQSDVLACAAGQWVEASAWINLVGLDTYEAVIGVQTGVAPNVDFGQSGTVANLGAGVQLAQGWQKISQRVLIPAGATGMRWLLRVRKMSATPTFSGSVYLDNVNLSVLPTPLAETWPRMPGTMLALTSSSAAIAANTPTPVAWTGFYSNLSSDASMWSSSAPSVINIPLDGRYAISGVLQYVTVNSTGQRQALLRRNGGSSMLMVTNASPTTSVSSVSFAITDVPCQVGDTIDLAAQHTATASLSYGGSGTSLTRLGISWIGPLNP